jgi:quinol monooxygenase YgiN
MSNRSVPPMRGSASTFRHRAGRGRIHSASLAGTRIYTAWQQESDPTKFVHLFEFTDEEAHRAHGTSAAVRKFEEVYQPELAAGPVVFTDYLQIASNQSR